MLGYADDTAARVVQVNAPASGSSREISSATQASGTIAWALGAAAVVAIIVVWLLVRRQASRLADRAEEAYPGPLDSQKGAVALSVDFTDEMVDFSRRLRVVFDHFIGKVKQGDSCG